jgi:hypothetical protein
MAKLMFAREKHMELTELSELPIQQTMPPCSCRIWIMASIPEGMHSVNSGTSKGTSSTFYTPV